MIWLVGLGGSLGAAFRFWVSQIINNRSSSPFPLATWIVNITGSFILGVLANLHMDHLIHEYVWFLFGIGFCGAFTTFSTFGYEITTLIHQKKTKLGIIYVSSSIVLGICSAFIGLTIV